VSGRAPTNPDLSPNSFTIWGFFLHSWGQDVVYKSLWPIKRMIMISTTLARPNTRFVTTCGLPRLFALTLLIVAGFANATQIYKSIDADGNVVFSDLPPAPGTTAEPVELAPANTFTAPAASVPGPGGPGQSGAPEDDPAAAGRYQALRVLDPPDDAGIRENAGNVAVTAELQPTLRSGHLLQLYLNGVLYQTAHAPQFQLTNVDRGTHVLELRVVDEAGNVVATSEPSVFHLQRRSLILQPAPSKPAPRS
jgi:hypothetical protein